MAQKIMACLPYLCRCDVIRKTKNNTTEPLVDALEGFDHGLLI